MLSDLKRIIDQISRDRGFDKELLVEAIEDAVLSAARKKLGSRRIIEVQYNEEFGEIEIFQFRNVVEEVTDDQTEIAFTAAKLLDPEVQLEDELGEKMENIEDLGRVAAQSAKQVIIHRMKDAERDAVYDLFKDRVGEVVSGIVQRFERGSMIVNLGRTDAVLTRDQQIPKRSFKQGDRIRAYLLNVKENARDSQLILSRTCDEFLAKLFEMEVPEIAEGIVKILGVSRDPGFRAKIAVSSIESDVDPVGACVGMKGARVQNVVQELQGERIDIVTWSPDPAKYVYNALAPAQVSMVMVDEEEKTLLVVVPNDQLSLAIGRQGQNVRLASRLLGWRIDVKSEQRYANLEDPGYKSLLAISGIDESLADQLLGRKIHSAAMLAAASVEELIVLRAVDEEQASKLIEGARVYNEQNPVPDEEKEEKLEVTEEIATDETELEKEVVAEVTEEIATDETELEKEVVAEVTEEIATDETELEKEVVAEVTEEIATDETELEKEVVAEVTEEIATDETELEKEVAADVTDGGEVSEDIVEEPETGNEVS